MDKKGFVKAFLAEDSYRMAKLFEALEKAKSSSRFYASDEFYAPNVWNKVMEMKDYRDIEVLGEDFFERKIFVVNREDEEPLSILEIENLNEEIKLTHKDYLGSIMSLGLNREKFGDIFLKGSKAYAVIFSSTQDFFINNLTRIGRCSIALKVFSYHEAIMFLQPNLTGKEAIIPSLRLDVVVAELAKTSRSKALEALSKGLVLVNYNETRDKAKEIKEGDTLTIRGKGKFKIGQVVGTTQKGNLRMAYFKFE